MPILVLLRHAKAERHHTDSQADDHARGLASRGRADAAAVRAWLEGKEIAPDRVVVSTARRARETWELASPGGVEPVYDARVYEASPDDLREVLAETPDGVATLVLVGHNPGVERLAWELDDSEAARDLTNQGLPTSAVALFTLTTWADLGGARLQELVVPRG